MDGLDAFAQLALMAKAKLVFESEGTFLSFPVLSPLTYPPERLKFVKPGGVATAQDLADQSEFARITNCIPRGVLAPAFTEEYLWDVYGEVLQTKVLASGTMSEGERLEYDKAMAFLYVPDADGLRRPSAALIAYCQHRDAWFKAQEQYKAAEQTAAPPSDPAIQARWRDTDEPRLREAVMQAEQAWLTAGQRARVEAAQQIEQTYAARDPALKWTEWQTSFMADLDTQTDTANIGYAPTGVSPYDLFDAGPWPPFTLTRDEMMRLVPQAPAELLAILGAGAGTPDIESVSFEFRSVALTRPWFEPRLFKSRFWRLAAGAEPLSDGGTPPKGRCPAYVSALVFARNVVVQQRPKAGGQPVITAVKPGVLLRMDDQRQVKANLYAAGIYAAAPKPVPPGNPTLQPRVGAQLGAGSTATFSPQRPGATRPVRQAGQSAPATRPAAAVGSRQRLEGAGWTAVAVAPPPRQAPPVDPTGKFVWVNDHWERKRAGPGAPTEPAPDPATETKPSDEITILAFICKRVPLCPDPDPALSW
jgi:hypothetical protein